MFNDTHLLGSAAAGHHSVNSLGYPPRVAGEGARRNPGGHRSLNHAGHPDIFASRES
jgi:hypothetical protein